MKISYINLDWNHAETEDITNIPDNLEKIDGIYFEKRGIETPKVETKKEEVKEETIDGELELRAKEFLKENKVRGFWLLRGQKIIDKAVELGFIIN